MSDIDRLTQVVSVQVSPVVRRMEKQLLGMRAVLILNSILLSLAIILILVQL